MTFKARGLYASSSKEPGGFRAGPLVLLGALVAVVLVAAVALSVLRGVDVDRRSLSDGFPGATALEIDNRTSGEVTISGGGEDVVLERTLHATPFQEPEERVDRSGERVRVRAECEGPWFLGDCAVDYDVSVPEGTAVAVATAGGSIRVANVEGSLELSSASGRVRVEEHTGDVEVSTASGRVELDEVQGSASVETASGRITASGSGPALRATTVSGSMDVSGFTAETVEAESTSGSLSVGGGFTTARISTTSGSVSVDTGSPFDLLEVDSTSGSVRIDVPDGSYDVRGESVSGARTVDVGTSPEADARIDVDTVSGSVGIG
ncbi:DUF4097 family beta strand repeat-containing protein [Nocardiopsis sp. LOL_012]|uniref:DUF4097 family beta strand repeat-containing protein n=1 Tax=Nocardiopsis sp. LOL_012 TaxID=3345409 RepID=UPI003A854674